MNLLGDESENTLLFLNSNNIGVDTKITFTSIPPPEIVQRMSYGSTFYGFKTNIENYGTSDPEQAFLNCEIYIEHLRINGEAFINSPLPPDRPRSLLLTSFNNSLADLDYKNEGYGLGPSFITDALSELSYFSDNNIRFYPGFDGQPKVILEIEKEARMLLVIKDIWELDGNNISVTWSILHNYDNLNKTFEVVGDLRSLTDQQLLELNKNDMIEWQTTTPPVL